MHDAHAPAAERLRYGARLAHGTAHRDDHLRWTRRDFLLRMGLASAGVAFSVGGIPEVVVPEETGLLVDLSLSPGTFEPTDPADFSSALAAAINRLARDPELRARMGKRGRERVLEHFSWDAIAETTIDLYRTLR